jgi:hypothetical protein
MAAPSGRVYSAYDRARRKAEKLYGKAAIAGKDIDHVRSLVKGGSNDPGNLRIRDRRANRADKTY